jgi:DNA-binding MarR family transcriptional regulator/GNAT superfamily N-acetyltransferase
MAVTESSPARAARVRRRTPSDAALPRIEAMRRFNRFYTRQIGVLGDRLFSPFTLTEGRVLYEIAHSAPVTATVLGRELGLDAGYLSRLLRGLTRRGFVTARTPTTDRRQSLLSLTAPGRRAFARLDAATRAEIQGMLDRVPPDERARLLEAMRDIEVLLAPPAEARVPYILRSPEPGDIGWIIHRQAVLYTTEYGWNGEYEALISRILADFIDHFDAACERCWVAERDGRIIGSIFVVKHPERSGVARLRMRYVEPAARGLGVGRRLVQEVTRFARQAGYHTLTLWTNSVLTHARRIYETEGYQLVHEDPHHSFGKDLVAQTWELPL